MVLMTVTICASYKNTVELSNLESPSATMKMVKLAGLRTVEFMNQKNATKMDLQMLELKPVPHHASTGVTRTNEMPRKDYDRNFRRRNDNDEKKEEEE